MINNFDIRRQRTEKERITLSSSFAFFLPSLRNSRSCLCLRLTISPTFSQRFSVLHFIHSSFISPITTTTVSTTDADDHPIEHFLVPCLSDRRQQQQHLFNSSPSQKSEDTFKCNSPEQRYCTTEIATDRFLAATTTSTHRPKPMSHEERMMVRMMMMI